MNMFKDSYEENDVSWWKIWRYNIEKKDLEVLPELSFKYVYVLVIDKTT